MSEAARESEAARANGIPSAQELLSRAAVTAFRLNGQFLSVADELARPAGLTSAWWQVLGAVLVEPLPVAGIARSMGITRQSVQRIADLLVERGLAEYTENPAHRRAKLLRVTDAGRRAVARIGPPHAEFAARLAGELGVEGLSDAVGALERLSEALDTLTGADRGGSGPSGAQGVSGVQGVSGGS
ncbi:MarR family winged helix-turn-helix transcriptional regulator [Streptomyces sp. JV180]|uniref:MarR family winged helix-turn-helix transcriptional regulator n=1 Tax=Streptomyces sp. JV180 TaxID=858634 RepID=UPI00295ECA7B|nr:MarR family winged helix-turn-helix transcriptional regulator [Streptomyces sp. JV180]